ncbi:MAG: DUF1905 domain-containing protein [Lewinellaceae bacterium]|nr:DUF1905 domain-containing protein [Lewinellaceae bacterium]
MKTEAPISFTSILDDFNSNLWHFHITVPGPVAQAFIDGSDRRVLCTLNDAETFQCALMPKGDGAYFININKKLRDKLKLKKGMQVQVSLVKDTSKYGLPMPEELEELLAQDEAGNFLFHALTPGKQRTLLYIVGSPKTTDTRLQRALTVVEHLKKNNGKINFRQLNEDLRAK